MHIKGAGTSQTIVTGGVKVDVKYTNFYLLKFSALTLKGTVVGKNAILQMSDINADGWDN
jgi:hypothetical protein